MQRISWKALEGLERTVNSALELRGSSARVVVERRYDYTALDLTTADYLENHPGATVRTLRIGSTGDLWAYMQAMFTALELLSPPYGPLDPWAPREKSGAR